MTTIITENWYQGALVLYSLLSKHAHRIIQPNIRWMLETLWRKSLKIRTASLHCFVFFVNGGLVKKMLNCGPTPLFCMQLKYFVVSLGCPNKHLYRTLIIFVLISHKEMKITYCPKFDQCIHQRSSFQPWPKLLFLLYHHTTGETSGSASHEVMLCSKVVMVTFFPQGNVAIDQKASLHLSGLKYLA